MTASTAARLKGLAHRLPIRLPLQVSALALAATLAACGGGGSNSTSGDGGGTGGGGGGSGGSTPTLSQRIAAATDTAASHPDCDASVLGPYYWEIGNADGMQASGRIGGSEAPSRDTAMNIFSASKWLYAASVVERRGVVDDDVPFLNFSSGYSTFGNTPVCLGGDTVASCQVLPIEQDPASIGRFAYDSGHMQQHAATIMGLGNADNAALAEHLRSTLGNFGFVYDVPQPATGVVASAAGYSGFLRKLLAGNLAISRQLGTHAICTNPDVPGCNAFHVANAGATEDMDYSLGHWVESDPSVGGDGSFNSVGGGGFYPWVDKDLRYYGILARQNAIEMDGAAHNSLVCGRLIRKAWMTGTAITS
ncbi:MAG: hypothetical protein H6933_01595 [Burkholderiaceae bacterium]|nr:hypothetical protein [Rhodoferax sp.]MCP5283573.1 hypothetical protein [Burkholderiaceae bacterium]